MRPGLRALLAGLGVLAAGAGARGADPTDAFARLAAEVEASSPPVLRGEDGFLFLGAELRHLGVRRFWGPDAAAASRASKPGWADPLPPIVDFAAQLRSRGVELLVVPVPAKAAVVPGAVPGIDAPPGARVDVGDHAFLEVLRGEGLEVLDLLPALREAAPGSVCRTDTHWSGLGAEIAARAVAAHIAERGWLADEPREKFASERREITIDGDLRRMLADPAVPEEPLTLRFVGRAARDRIVPVAPDRDSPLLVLGDSHALVFQAGGDLHARGAGLPDQLALELGFAVDLVAVRGSGATPARISLARRADDLAGKRVVVWVFAAREFTESVQGWRKVPVVR